MKTAGGTTNVSRSNPCNHCGGTEPIGQLGECAICHRAAQRRGYEQQEARKAHLRRQGYSEEYINGGRT